MQVSIGRIAVLASQCCAIFGLLLAPCAWVHAQLSSSAYRALGQKDLRQNGTNMVDSGTLSSPNALAIDSEGHLFVADTSNNRILGWKSAASFQNDAAADLWLGQPTGGHSNPLGIGAKGFVFPLGLAVDPATGNVFVADLGNNRVLRFLKPFVNPSRVEPDAVYGQPDFSTRGANSSGITARTMSGPRGAAFDRAGNLWVADSGNHRILRFPASVLSTANPAADLVLGQKDFISGIPDHGDAVSASGFNTPVSLIFDAQDNLYVADFLNARVLKFPAPITVDSLATNVFGQANLTTRGVPQVATASSMAGPTNLWLGGAGNLYVAVPNGNRVLIFDSGAKAGSPAKDVIGQPNLTIVTANTNAFPRASATSLAAPADVKMDADGNIFLADSGNNRVLRFPPSSKAAAGVLGQIDFAGNGPNQIKPGSINAAFKIAIDYSHSPFALYVADSNNNRVLVWKDSARFRTGDPADLVIGQPDLTTAVANVDSGGTRAPTRTSLSAPKGLAVASDGTVYVADAGNNRVLRYPRPVDQSARITPDAVLGQPDFTSANSASVSESSLHSPAGLALGPNRDLFVADAGNNRVLEFSAGAGTGATAVRVFGQPSFLSSTQPNGASAQVLFAPQGLFVDAASNLYVADAGFSRVLIFPDTKDAPTTGLAASIVVGQQTFDASVRGAGPAGLNVPLDLALDSTGSIWVSDEGNNRVLMFPSLLTLPTAGAQASFVIGQPNAFTASSNYNSPDALATPEGLSAPAGIYLDRRDTLYVGDAGNNRVAHYLKPVAVVNGAHFQASVPVGRGAWTTLFGSGLSTETKLVHTSTLPTALAGRELVVNDEFKSPLYYVSPGQINLLIPSAAPLGLQRLAARVSDTGELLAGGPFSIAAYSPGFFTEGSTGTGQARALNQDNSLNGPSKPAARGTVVQLFGTGQGPVVSPVVDGQPAPSAPDKTVAVPTADASTCLNHQPALCVAVGSKLVETPYSGLAPGLIGVWQVNIKIPADFPDALTGNAVPVVVLIGGANKSNVITLAIK